MIYDLVDKNDPILRERLEEFDFANPPVDPIELAHDLAQSMLAHDSGMGLSANQIGLPYRVFAVRSNPILVCFNPRIVDAEPDEVYLEEGCLTYANLFVKIKRPRRIRVRYTEPNGNVETRIFDGITARIVQHELDHLNGMLYSKRSNKIHLEQAHKNAKKAGRAKSKELHNGN